MNNYVAPAVAVVGLSGARLLVGPKSVVTTREAELKQMVVVVEFDGYEIALAAYESAEYKKAGAALGSGVEGDFRIAEGFSRSLSIGARRFELRSKAYLSTMRLREDRVPQILDLGHPPRPKRFKKDETEFAVATLSSNRQLTFSLFMLLSY